MCLHPNIRALTNPRAPGSSQPGNLQNDIVLAWPVLLLRQICFCLRILLLSHTQHLILQAQHTQGCWAGGLWWLRSWFVSFRGCSSIFQKHDLGKGGDSTPRHPPVAIARSLLTGKNTIQRTRVSDTRKVLRPRDHYCPVLFSFATESIVLTDLTNLYSLYQLQFELFMSERSPFKR